MGWQWILVGALAGLTGGCSAQAAERVNPEHMQRAPLVAGPGALDPRIIGKWEVWIPGAVQYLADGRAVYQQYQPGAAMNQLEIARDGSYRWGGQRGRLEEVRPWHHQPGRRYYRVRRANGDEFEFYHADDGDRLIVLFGGVGGHAATGTRLAGGGLQAAPGATRTFRAGERVEVDWSGRWYPAQVRKVDGGRYLIGYDGYDSSWDEWVPPARIRPRASETKGPGTTGQPSVSTGADPLGMDWAGSSSMGGNGNATSASDANPLGVQWQGDTRAPPPPTGRGDNPLGMEWVTNGSPPSVVQPRPQSPLEPAGPAPILSPGVVQGPPVPTPTTPPPTNQPPVPPDPSPAAPLPGGATPLLVDRWLYQAVAFQSSDGRLDSEHRDVRGALTFKPDGSYEQDLTIGGILNAIKGRYRVVGDRVITEYSWRGQTASDEMVIQLSADRRLLTLVRHGSPAVWYTLRRAE
ncbi:MBT domain-containing protein [Luteimonas granuli]|uniref:MBT domain-containing protein n=1 Tax=Luteimonas granuli TaxID=1176533 RepID=UPI001AF007DF|nr:agenet domain-containing protein [Luteimonas granuli]